MSDSDITQRVYVPLLRAEEPDREEELARLVQLQPVRDELLRMSRRREDEDTRPIRR